MIFFRQLQTLFYLRNCPALNSIELNVLSVTVKSSGVHLEASLGVRQFRRYSGCTLRCEVSILDSGKQCKNDFIVLSNFRATIGIVSPTLLIWLVPKGSKGFICHNDFWH